MSFRKYVTPNDVPSCSMEPLKFSNKVHEKTQLAEIESVVGPLMESQVDIDLKEIYFLIMHFLSAGPCHKTYGQLLNELLEHQLLPRRYHAWYSRSGVNSGDENDNGLSLPLGYNQLVERYCHIEKDHLVKLMKQLILSRASPLQGMVGGNGPNAADVPTLLGSGSFSLLESDRKREDIPIKRLPGYLRWPHLQADQVRGLSLREIGGGFTKHHRSPSIRAACYAVAKPSTLVQRMDNAKTIRGHRNSVYCAIFDRSGRYVITGSDDRLVKIWSMETAFCLASCRGHEGDITDLAVSSNNFLVASSSNDFIIRVWRMPDGAPVSVLQGHTAAVTAIAFSPRPGCAHHLLSSSDDGTCRIWDARHSQSSLRVYVPKPSDPVVGKMNVPSSSTSPPSHQILCCAYNANGTVFVTGSSDTYARVWNACKASTENPEEPNHEMDLLSGHENDVNYVQFSGCAVASRSSVSDTLKEENIPKFKNSWFTHDNIVTCSRDGSAIIWIPRSRRSHGKVGRWTRAYHLKVPPPPMPPQTSRGGPRQRFAPTPRGVNMIIWSLDNRFVLAAIMDCRICVWNAVDGSLVHSLTGHTDSTYVLDVHPFNPRIAMSAGYDGKTIVWDIWEGTPIRIYDKYQGHFKMVDGKFSPDGTSIVLSDDVGQIYFLSTGQGESQKDAKYDQFFLGDYRPLIRDVHGNVLDQETQLVPFRRNIQDLLCDASFIPYEEPYQSMYQKRRLSTLGIEWRPSPVNLVIGPVYDTQDYQLLPLPDLDRMIEPIPEFLDAMDWAPENEIQSDDNDSEYNVPEEHCSEGDQGSLSDGLSGDPDCSAEDSEIGESNGNGFHRSKRRKHKAVVEFMTSSGRRVKRRNLDERDGSLSQYNKNKKPRNTQKAKKKKSSTSKLLRPQRVAARNALNIFSQISRGSSNEDEYSSETDTSEDESTVPDLKLQSKSNRSLQNVLQERRENEASLVDSEDVARALEPPKSHTDAGRKKLILRFPARPNKLETLDGTSSEVNKQMNSVRFKASQESTEMNSSKLSFQDLGSSSGGVTDVKLPHNYTGIRISERQQSQRVENLWDLAGWGDVKARTSKRFRSGESITVNTCPRSAANRDEHNGIVGNLKLESENGMPSSYSERESSEDKIDIKASLIEEQLRPGISEDLGGPADEKLPYDDHQQKEGEYPVTSTGSLKEGHEDEPRRADCLDYNESLVSVAGRGDDKMVSDLSYKGVMDHSEKLKENASPIPKIRIKSKMFWKDSSDPSKLKSVNSIHEGNSSGYNLNSQQDTILVADEDEGPSRASPDHELETSEVPTDNKSLLSRSDDSKSKMYKAVYTRSKSYRVRTDSDGDGGGMEESTSNASIQNLDSRMNFSEPSGNGIRRMRSMRSGGHGSVEASRSTEKFTTNTREPLVHEDWKSNEGLTVRIRSARNRKANYCDSDMNSLDKRKSHPPTRKLSWLMLSEHEESRRYIPQQGDNVVYIRQGHQQYEESRRRSGVSDLWRSLKGNVRAVEFCKIESLTYSTSTGSGESCCKLTLEFVDPSSSLFGEKFKLNLPELVNFADFVVERSLYDASIKRNWTTRDKCEIWWRTDSGEGGDWWEGRIVSVKPKFPEFPDSPWERFTVKYKNDQSDFQHSPWELRDPEMPWEPPCIDNLSRAKLLSFFEMLEHSREKNQDRYGIHRLTQVSWKKEFVNRYPVPMSFDVIHSRLENNYYRNLEAVEHDFQVMLSNAYDYFGNSVEIQKKMKRLSDSFNEIMSTL